MTTATSEKIRCDACPVMCYIADGQTGACDRYGNQRGRIVRCDPLIVLEQRTEDRGEIVPFLNHAADWDGEIINPPDRFVTAIGAGTTYPD
ncbi:MAG: 6-hydroxynicotinate reductase, partial [Alphaproteobacteria bacterium]